MLSFIGFDTIIIFYNRQTADDIVAIITLLYKIGIKNFIIAFDFDPLIDSISVMRYKLDNFNKSIRVVIPNRIKIKYTFNLVMSQGVAFNDDVQRLYANRKNKTLFVSLPLFLDNNYEPISHDINHLLYKRKIITAFTSFEKTVETSSLDFCMKFIDNPKISFTVDINYLFNPDKQRFVDSVLTSNTLFLPSISNSLSNYAGILSAADNALEIYGKKKYYKLCTQINRASIKLV